MAFIGVLEIGVAALSVLLARFADLVAMRTQELNRQQQSEAGSLARRSIEPVLSVLDEQIVAIEKEIDDHIIRTRA